MRDKFLKGRATGKGHCGEEHYGHKLTAAQVIEARKRFKQGEKCRKIADEYGMTYWSMWAAITGETWKHLK